MDLRPVHPGKQLAEQLAELGLSANVFARMIDVPANRVTEIIKGRRAISADTALRLERFFGPGAILWMHRQSQYDLREALKVSGREILKLPSINGNRNPLPKI
jgi:addiction module HigA family antidote